MCRYKTILKVFSACVLAVPEFRGKECVGIFHFWEGGQRCYVHVKFMPPNPVLYSLFLSA
jgi:hypothetical protein